MTAGGGGGVGGRGGYDCPFASCVPILLIPTSIVLFSESALRAPMICLTVRLSENLQEELIFLGNDYGLRVVGCACPIYFLIHTRPYSSLISQWPSHIPRLL